MPLSNLTTKTNSNGTKYVNDARGYTDTGTGYKPTTIKTEDKTYVQPHGSNKVYVGENKDGYVLYNGNSNNNNDGNYRRYYGGGGSGSASGDGSGVWNAGGRQGQDDTLDKIKELLSEQEKKANDYYKTLYEQQIAQNKQGFENNRNQINLNYKRGERYINNQYGNGISGAGLTNRIRNNSNWINNLTSNRQNYENNDATALASYNNNRANSASTLAQGWYNYVMPIYTNRQQSDDDYSYRRFLAQNGWL